MNMKVEVFKYSGKNVFGEYTAQVDFGETQIQISCRKRKELNRLVTEIKKVIKP